MVVKDNLETWKPIENNNFLWLPLANKILTHDNGNKRIWHGLGWYVLCKIVCEFVSFLEIAMKISIDLN